jgi:hypothetical protein
MVADIITSWRPDSLLPAQNHGTAAPDRDLPPRASWKLVTDALAGRASPRWAEVRVLRLDGPHATDAAVEALATSGCLDHIETLHLAAESLSSHAVATALALPALTTLRLDGVSAAVLAAQPAGSLRSIELFQCSPETCAAVLRAVDGVAAVDIDSVALPLQHREVWELLAHLELVSLRVARTPCSGPALEQALRSSTTSLASLTLDAVTGIDSDQFLAGQAWTALRALHWHQSKIDHLGAHLPATLTTLSLRETAVGSLDLDPTSPSNLSSLDCVGSTTSDEMATRLYAHPGRLVRLGLGASEAAARAIAALSRAADSPLRTLELGNGPGAASSMQTVSAVPATVESLTFAEPWTLDDDLLRDLLRGDRASGLRELSFHGVKLGNPDLGGQFSPILRRLELRSCTGFLEGLGHGGRSLALACLALDDIEVRQDELVELLSRCDDLVSLRLERVVGVAPEGLSMVLDHVGKSVTQLVLRQFPGDAGSEYGDALIASSYPRLAELWLDRTMSSGRALSHLMNFSVTPALERLELDYQAPDEQWLQLIERAPSSLHWIKGFYAGDLDTLVSLLRDEGSGVAGASIHLRRGTR